MDGLRIPEVDDPWMQRSDRLPFPVEWSARIYVRKPEEVAGELQRQMGKVRSQIRHYTHDHDLDPPMSLARQADRVLRDRGRALQRAHPAQHPALRLVADRGRRAATRPRR